VHAGGERRGVTVGRREFPTVEIPLDDDLVRPPPALRARILEDDRAASDGVVVLARDCVLSGRTVLVHHGAGVFTGYFHLSRIDVRDGARVTRGDRVGRVGATGRTTGPHLHFAVRADGRYVDPPALLGLGWVPAPPDASVARTVGRFPSCKTCGPRRTRHGIPGVDQGGNGGPELGRREARQGRRLR
jgi:hypothetical protein